MMHQLLPSGEVILIDISKHFNLHSSESLNGRKENEKNEQLKRDKEKYCREFTVREFNH